MVVNGFHKNRQYFKKSKLGLDKSFGFVKLNIINPTALSVYRDGGLIFYG